MFEPDAYERQQQDYERRIYSRQPVQQPIKVIQPVDGKPVFYTAQDVLNLPVPEERFIKTGIADIDKKLRGMKKRLRFRYVWTAGRRKEFCDF